MQVTMLDPPGIFHVGRGRRHIQHRGPCSTGKRLRPRRTAHAHVGNVAWTAALTVTETLAAPSPANAASDHALSAKRLTTRNRYATGRRRREK
jgi:hypothetical protein